MAASAIDGPWFVIAIWYSNRPPASSGAWSALVAVRPSTGASSVSTAGSSLLSVSVSGVVVATVTRFV